MSQPATTTPLSVLLVHAAFADSSSWNDVIERLQAGAVNIVEGAEELRQ